MMKTRMQNNDYEYQEQNVHKIKNAKQKNERKGGPATLDKKPAQVSGEAAAR